MSAGEKPSSLVGGSNPANNVIDLTEETDAESEARALRVGLVQDGTLEPFIKQEEDDGGLTDTESECEDDSDDGNTDGEGDLRSARKKQTTASRRPKPASLPESAEDVQKTIRMLSAQLEMLKQQTEKTENKKPKARRPRAVDQDVAKLETREQEPAADKPVKADEVRVKMEDTDTVRLPPRIPLGAAMAGAKRKRSSGSQRKPLPARKKAKKPKGASAAPKRPRSSKAAREGVELILSMLQRGDRLTTGQEMADLPILQGIKATTISDQNQQLRGLTSAHADPKQIRGDNFMLVKARGALARRFKAANEKFLIKGMKTALFAYQFAAVGWMVRRELGKLGGEAAGGLLADTMGLGKTVQTLACIIGNPPSEDDVEEGRIITLVVVPANAVQQWVGEIYRHCKSINGCVYKRSDGVDLALRSNFSIW